MKVIIEFSNKFIKDLRKSPQNVKIAFRKRLEVYLTDRYHPILHYHALKGSYSRYKSINITGDWRAIFRELDDGEIIFFDRLGTHSQLYK